MIDEPADAERQAAAALLRLSWGTHISRAVYAAAEPGIADLLADGPVSCAELARATGTHEAALYRVLRLLAGLGVLDAFAPSFAGAYDFSDLRTVVDVGGGMGILLVAILRRHPHLRGVLLETPGVAAQADAVLDAREIRDRCEVMAGDFFDRVPPADCYVLANVLHDWDDGRAFPRS
jgi:hypothetical protein